MECEVKGYQGFLPESSKNQIIVMPFLIKETLLKLAISTFGFFLLPGVDIINHSSKSLAIIIPFLLANLLLFKVFLSDNLTSKETNLFLFHSIKSFVITSMMIFSIMILFGAPISIWLDKTILSSCYIAAQILFCNTSKRANGHFLHISCTTFFVSWLFAFVLPLDWQKDYQVSTLSSC
jgi:hypothetical protein